MRIVRPLRDVLDDEVLLYRDLQAPELLGHTACVSLESAQQSAGTMDDVSAAFVQRIHDLGQGRVGWQDAPGIAA